MTHIRTHEGWLYLAVFVDLFSRRMIGWPMESRILKELVLHALLAALWRRNRKSTVTVRSDQVADMPATIGGGSWRRMDGKTA